MNRVIGHLDLDYFYAQVEEVENPSLKKLPVLVCVYSGRTEESGVVSTANYKAREYGIKSGMPIVFAKRKLEGIEAKFLPMKHEKYEVISERIMKLVRSKVDVIEQSSIDEAFFDITDRTEGDYGRAEFVASMIKREIFQTEGLTCSIGIAPNKIVAKIASEFKKPDGMTVVTPDQVINLISPLSVDKLYGVGTKTSRILQAKGIKTIGDLAHTDLAALEESLDRKLAAYVHNAANGINDEPVVERGEAAQISRMVTLKKNSRDVSEILAQLTAAMEDVHMKALSKNLYFKSISVVGVLTDLSVKTKSRTLETPTNDLTAITTNTRELIGDLIDSFEGKLRRAGVRVSEFTSTVKQRSLSEYIES